MIVRLVSSFRECTVGVLCWLKAVAVLLSFCLPCLPCALPPLVLFAIPGWPCFGSVRAIQSSEGLDFGFPAIKRGRRSLLLTGPASLPAVYQRYLAPAVGGGLSRAPAGPTSFTEYSFGWGKFEFYKKAL